MPTNQNNINTFVFATYLLPNQKKQNFPSPSSSPLFRVKTYRQGQIFTMASIELLEAFVQIVACSCWPSEPKKKHHHQQKPNPTFDSLILDTAKLQNELRSLCHLHDRVFTLLYRATRDGFTSHDFHTKCDQRAHTLAVFKTTNGSIFGGYTQATWSTQDTKCSYKMDAHSFAFSLRNDVEQPMLMPIANPAYAIFASDKHGPSFGGGNSMIVEDGDEDNDTDNDADEHLDTDQADSGCFYSTHDDDDIRRRPRQLRRVKLCKDYMIRSHGIDAAAAATSGSLHHVEIWSNAESGHFQPLEIEVFQINQPTN